MDDRERLDLSALAPDPERWRAATAGTLARVDAALRERPRPRDPLVAIAAWRRPVLAAAACAVLLLVPLELAMEAREDRPRPVRELVTLSTEWARGAGQPTGADLLRAVAGGGAP